MRHHRHALLQHSAWMAFVTYVARTATEQTGEVAFHHRTAIATGAGQQHLVRSPLTVYARLVEDGEDFIGARSLVRGFDRLGDPHRENPSRMQCLTQRWVIDAEIPRHRVDVESGCRRDTLYGQIDLIEQGQHRTGITRIARGDSVGKDKTCRGLGDNARFTAKLHRAIALAFENGRDGEVVGIDKFTVTEFLAVGEPCGLRADVRLAAQRRVERIGETLALGVAQRRRLLKELLRVLPKRGDGLSKLQELPFRVAHQGHKDVPLPSALAAKAPQDFF